MRNILTHWSDDWCRPTAEFWRKLEAVVGFPFSNGLRAELEAAMYHCHGALIAHEKSARTHLVHALLKRIRRRLAAQKPFDELLRLGSQEPNDKLVARSAFERIQFAARTLDMVHVSRMDLQSVPEKDSRWVRYVEWALENTTGGNGGDAQTARAELLSAASAIFNKAGRCDEKSSREIVKFQQIICAAAGLGKISRAALLKQL